MPTNKNIKQFAARRSPTLFAIEGNSTHSLLGYVGLSIHTRSATGLIEYYIFKQYRKKGYCKEAVNALADKVKNNQLYGPVESIQEGVYSEEAIKINAIRARIAVINTASIKTVQSCGFIYEATINKTYFSANGWVDEVIYYLPKDLSKYE